MAKHDDDGAVRLQTMTPYQITGGTLETTKMRAENNSVQ